ncbi:hypothetical protein ACVWWN_003562 [Mycobacterium sp. URHB0021]|jgi:hypothetical protein
MNAATTSPQYSYGLGKLGYRRPERRLEAMLGVGYLEPTVHQLAFQTSADYRTLVFKELQATEWSQDVVDVADATTALALTAPLLGFRLTNDESWRLWVRAHTGECQAFRGTLGAKVVVCKPADPEAKGLIERCHDHLERSFLPESIR